MYLKLVINKMSAHLFRLQYVKGSSWSQWTRVTHICVSKLTIIGSDNGLSPRRRQTIIWTNVAILAIWRQRTYISEILFKIQKFPLKKMHLNMSSAKWRPFCLGLNVLKISRAASTLPCWGSTRQAFDVVFTSLISVSRQLPTYIASVEWYLGPHLLTWFNINPSMDKLLHTL